MVSRVPRPGRTTRRACPRSPRSGRPGRAVRSATWPRCRTRRRRRRPPPPGRRRSMGDPDAGPTGAGMLQAVGESFADEEVGGALDLVAEARPPQLRRTVNGHSDGQARRPDLDRLDEAVIRQHRRVNARRQLAKVLERVACLDLETGEGLVERAGLTAELVTGQTDPGDEGDQLLLSAVVDVTLDLAASRLVGGHDARRATPPVRWSSPGSRPAVPGVARQAERCARQRYLPGQRGQQFGVDRRVAAPLDHGGAVRTRSRRGCRLPARVGADAEGPSATLSISPATTVRTPSTRTRTQRAPIPRGRSTQRS